MTLDTAIEEQMINLLPKLRSFALGLTGSGPDADDLVQATFERAIKNMDKWIPGSRLDSWMYRIAQNLHRNSIRNESGRSRIIEEISFNQPKTIDGVQEAETARTAGQVWKRIQSLSAEQREVLVLICINGLSYRETAETLRVPIGTVTSRLARAREELSPIMDMEPSFGKTQS